MVVPESAQVIDEGGALFAKRAVYGRKKGSADPDGPVIRLVGDARFSKVVVQRGHYNPWIKWTHWLEGMPAA